MQHLQERIIWDGYKPLVFTTDQGKANLNPNIYLVFSYKSDNYDANNFLYMSYPQLFQLREAFEDIKNLVVNNAGFIVADGTISVKQEYSAPVVINSIGKQNKWLALKLEAFNFTENGITTQQPGVSIEISSTNGYKSVLSVEEFLTVYTLLKDIDLASIQCQVSLAYLMSEQSAPQQPMPYQSNYQYYQQPQQPYQNNSYRAQPQYGNQSYRQAPQGRPASSQYQQAPAQQSYQQAPVQQPQQPKQQNNNLPPRTEKQIMTLAAVEETPTSMADYNDDAAIDEIFGN